jgi:hypothetical protein
MQKKKEGRKEEKGKGNNFSGVSRAFAKEQREVFCATRDFSSWKQPKKEKRRKNKTEEEEK